MTGAGGEGLATPAGYQLIERLATLREYRHLCEGVGWGEMMNFEAAAEALPRSLYGVVAVQDGETVGMGRVVGDGAIFYYLQDVAVVPEHQGRGLGSQIVGRLVALVRKNAPDKAFLGVFAAQGSLPFYQRFGFDVYPALTGMFQVVLERSKSA